MADLKFVFVVCCVFAFAGLSQVEAGSMKTKREVEAQEKTQVEKVQEQLMTAFDSLKKTMEDLAAKFNTDDIVQGVQNLTSKIETYAKQAADQFASSASGTETEKAAEATEQQQPQQPQP